MTKDVLKNAIICLETIETRLFHLVEKSPEFEEELKALRYQILKLNQQMILEKRKEDRRQTQDRRQIERRVHQNRRR